MRVYKKFILKKVFLSFSPSQRSCLKIMIPERSLPAQLSFLTHNENSQKREIDDLKFTPRKRFTEEEDQKLRMLCMDPEMKTWGDVAKKMPGRTARQCKDRYNVTLKNNIIKKPWTKKEDEIIISKYHEIGPRWVAISSFLVGRSGNNVKNRWYKKINKYRQIAPFIPKIYKENERQEIVTQSIFNNNDFNENDFSMQFFDNFDFDDDFVFE